MRVVPVVRRVPALLLVLALSGVATAADDALAPGSVLEQANAAQAETLLPPETVAHYRAGEYRNTVGRWPDVQPWEADFAAASSANAERLDVDAHGTIVERAGSKPAGPVYGLPFRIDPADPAAGVKVIWNAYHALSRIGTSHDLVGMAWVGKRGVEREAVLDTNTLFYDGAPPALVPKENPLELLSQQRALVTAPADLNGTTSLAWRFRGADRRDQSWIYVPALRRVRQVSPANRSDGFLGSDLSQDDGASFDGKPEDFTWRLVGERDGLVLADPASLDGTAERRKRSDGGFEDVWATDRKVVGYQDPGWRGLPWAPVAPVLVRRKLWIVEAVPRDPYYLFAKIEIAFDHETFQGVRSRKFDARGELLRSLQFLVYAARPWEGAGKPQLLPATSMGYIAAENTKVGRATVVGIAPPGQSVHGREGPAGRDLFTLEKLNAGK